MHNISNLYVEQQCVVEGMLFLPCTYYHGMAIYIFVHILYVSRIGSPLRLGWKSIRSVGHWRNRNRYQTILREDNQKPWPQSTKYRVRRTFQRRPNRFRCVYIFPIQCIRNILVANIITWCACRAVASSHWHLVGRLPMIRMPSIR